MTHIAAVYRHSIIGWKGLGVAGLRERKITRLTVVLPTGLLWRCWCVPNVMYYTLYASMKILEVCSCSYTQTAFHPSGAMLVRCDHRLAPTTRHPACPIQPGAAQECHNTEAKPFNSVFATAHVVQLRTSELPFSIEVDQMTIFVCGQAQPQRHE